MVELDATARSIRAFFIRTYHVRKRHRISRADSCLFVSAETPTFVPSSRVQIVASSSALPDVSLSS
jgi:hypothetical protein